MAKNFYNWQRYWCPRDVSYSLQDDGFLSDPKGEWGAALNPNLLAFEDVAQTPCLVLLGEPGMGKTSTIEASRTAIQGEVRAAGHEVLWVDLQTGDTEDRLIKKIFETPIFRAWQDGSHKLYLFLDSLDECLLRVSTVAALLKEELEKYPVERLRLRIACRTAEWPALLEDGLTQQWGEGAIQIVELAPLRRVDVVIAAQTRGIESLDFLNAVRNAEAVPLAIRPITLDFLLTMYLQTGSLPSTQVELYQRGCRLLCEELSKSRRASGAKGNLTADQRMVIAGRIAALTLLSSRYAICTEADQCNFLPGTLSIREITGGTEKIAGGVFAVTEAAVEETLGTGLFSACGAGLLGWSHQTYAEFLAAWYLCQQQIPQDQILSLIRHPGDAHNHLVPQLEEMASWIACMAPGVFKEIMTTDPAVLLRSDVATADASDRENLVTRLLEKSEEGLLQDRWIYDYRQRFRKLNYPRLHEQLTPIIIDRGREPEARRLAISIAEACCCVEIQSELADAALDINDVLVVRVHAAYAVQRIADKATRERLKPLAIGEAGDDPDDELKGCGLRALWPEILTVTELFPLINKPKKRDLHGLYRNFLEGELTAHLQVADLPVALRWAAQHQADHHQIAALDKLAWQIVQLGWQEMDKPGVLAPLAGAVLNRIRQRIAIPGDDSGAEVLSSQYSKRRRLINAVLDQPNISDTDIHLMAFLSPPLVLTTDIPWLIQRANETSGSESERLYAQLVGRLFHYEDRENLDAVLSASQGGGALSEILATRFEAMSLDSSIAKQLQEYAREEEQGRSLHVHTLLTPPPAERIALCLDQFEDGLVDAWWRLNLEITLRPNSRNYGSEHTFDLTQEPGWQAADDQMRLRILAAAEKYLHQQDPEPDRWFGANIPSRPALAGYRAFRLLLSEQREALSGLPNQIWTKWIPVILSVPIISSNEENEKHRLMVGLAFRKDPTAIIDVLLKIIDQQIAKKESLLSLDTIAYCWSPALASALLAKAKEDGLRAGNVSVLLGEVLRRDEPDLITIRDEARRFAGSLIAAFVARPMSVAARPMAIAAAHELMLHTPDAGWPEVWPIIQEHTDFGRSLLEEVACRDRRRGQIVQRLTEEQSGDLFLWLATQYPHAEDPQHEGVHHIGPRDEIAEWRDSLVGNLERKGTLNAVHALQQIVAARPDLSWLRSVLLRAQENTRRITWSPLPPDQILRLTGDSSLRFVQSGHQLLQVVIESLTRLQRQLTGETPMAQFLWDDMPSRQLHRPKDEEAFSNYVKDHLVQDLKDRGIIVNREVQIRQGHGKTTGQDTDIHVDAIVQGHGGEVSDRITVIIESKGCWHRELNSAMETQLVGRYLKNNSCRHGLYLIGWFRSASWDPSDARLQTIPKITFDQAKNTLINQATQLSVGDLEIAAFVLDIPL